MIDASSKTGNAGLVELSGNGIIDVGSGVSINLAAPNGKAGTLLIDPTDVVIGDASQGDTGVTLSNTSDRQRHRGDERWCATYLVQADNSVTLAAHAVIDARHLDANGHSTGNANNVEIEAPTINIVRTARRFSPRRSIPAERRYTSGNVTLAATASDSKLSGQATATTGITVDGRITGGDITIGAVSTATSSFTSSVPGLFALVGDARSRPRCSASTAAMSPRAPPRRSTSTATPTSTAPATSRSPRTVRRRRRIRRIASTLLGGSPIGASAVVGKIDGNVTTNVASGATISAGGNLGIHAINDATLNVAAVAATSSAQFVATVAYSTGSVSTTANVATGANLSVRQR